MRVCHEGSEPLRVSVHTTDGRTLVHAFIPPHTITDVYVPNVPPLRRGLCRFGDDGRAAAFVGEWND